MVMLATRNKNANKTKIDYDLNVFQLEQLQDDDTFAYSGPWYIQVYKYTSTDGPRDIAQPFALTQSETDALCLGQEGTYFDYEDSWYGMQGFLQDYWDCLSDRVKQYLESFPKYEEDRIVG
jgi:hypothetical protein